MFFRPSFSTYRKCCFGVNTKGNNQLALSIAVFITSEVIGFCYQSSAVSLRSNGFIAVGGHIDETNESDKDKGQAM